MAIRLRNISDRKGKELVAITNFGTTPISIVYSRTNHPLVDSEISFDKDGIARINSRKTLTIEKHRLDDEQVKSLDLNSAVGMSSRKSDFVENILVIVNALLKEDGGKLLTEAGDVILAG